MKAMTVPRRPTSAPITAKTRKRYRKDLAAANPPVYVGPLPGAGLIVSKVPMATSLKANDDNLMRFIRANRAARIDEGEVLEGGGGHIANIKANLRVVTDTLATEGRDSIQKAREIAEELEDWGDCMDGTYQFLQDQSILILQSRGTTYYIPGQGKAPLEDTDESKDEIMDDALVDYMRTAGDLQRFRRSSAQNPAPSGAFMRPEAPSDQILAKRVSNELQSVRNGMFRLETMMNERAERGSSTQTQVYRNESSLRKWAKRKQEEEKLHLKKAENIQTADEMIALRLHTLTPSKTEGKDGLLLPNARRQSSTLNPAAWGGALLKLNSGLDGARSQPRRRVQSARGVRSSEWSQDQYASSESSSPRQRPPTAPPVHLRHDIARSSPPDGSPRPAGARSAPGAVRRGSSFRAGMGAAPGPFWQVQRGVSLAGPGSGHGPQHLNSQAATLPVTAKGEGNERGSEWSPGMARRVIFAAGKGGEHAEGTEEAQLEQHWHQRGEGDSEEAGALRGRIAAASAYESEDVGSAPLAQTIRPGFGLYQLGSVEVRIGGASRQRSVNGPGGATTAAAAIGRTETRGGNAFEDEVALAPPVRITGTRPGPGLEDSELEHSPAAQALAARAEVDLAGSLQARPRSAGAVPADVDLWDSSWEEAPSALSLNAVESRSRSGHWHCEGGPGLQVGSRSVPAGRGARRWGLSGEEEVRTPRRPATARPRLMGGGGGTVVSGRVGLGALASGCAAARQLVQARDEKRVAQRPQSAYLARARGLLPARQDAAHGGWPRQFGARPTA